MACAADMLQPVVVPEASPATTEATPTPTASPKDSSSTSTIEAPQSVGPDSSDGSRWSVLFPIMVFHGTEPSGGVNKYMPRKLDSAGRWVLTPGIGIEYEGERSLDALVAYIKDCYDHPAGTIQVGQYFKWGSIIRVGYTLGLYVRQTPEFCYNSVSPGGGPSGHGPPSRGGFRFSSCAVGDNLPWQFTVASGDGYIDIIPTPFLNISAQVYHGKFDIILKLASNFFLNELGIGIGF